MKERSIEGRKYPKHIILRDAPTTELRVFSISFYLFLLALIDRNGRMTEIEQL